MRWGEKCSFLCMFRYRRLLSTSKISLERPESSRTNPSNLFFDLWGSISEVFGEVGDHLLVLISNQLGDRTFRCSEF